MQRSRREDEAERPEYRERQHIEWWLIAEQRVLDPEVATSMCELARTGGTSSPFNGGDGILEKILLLSVLRFRISCVST